MRTRTVVKAVVLGAALTLVAPGIAYASTTATVTTPGTTTFSSPGNGVKLSTNTSCASNLISGGGVNAVTTSGTTQEANAIHVMETEPGSSGSPASNGAADVTQWLGIAGTGGHGTGTYTVQPFAVCFTNTTITHTQVVLPSSTSGPNGIDATATSTANCPTNTRLLGGGAQSTLASNKRVKVIASYPSDNTGLAASDASTNPTSWTVYALNGDMADSGNTTAAYAICSKSGIDVSGVTVTVKHTNVSGPTSASSTQTATTSACGTGEGNLISGGASISGSDPTSGWTDPGDGGDHLDGDYPSSDSSGTPTTNNSSTTSWTAIAHSGGTATPTTYTDAWGLCMN